MMATVRLSREILRFIFDCFIFELFPRMTHAEEFADINDVKLQFIKMRFYYLTLQLNVANLKVSCRVIDKFLFASSYYHLFFLQERNAFSMHMSGESI
jgi:hypothetical protein